MKRNDMLLSQITGLKYRVTRVTRTHVWLCWAAYRNQRGVSHRVSRTRLEHDTNFAPTQEPCRTLQRNDILIKRSSRVKYRVTRMTRTHVWLCWAAYGNRRGLSQKVPRAIIEEKYETSN